MLPDSAKFLRDMLDCVLIIQQYTLGHTADDYNHDRKLRDSVQWNLAVMGEALSQLAKIDPPFAEQIVDYHAIIGLRNRLIHGYGAIDDEIVWDIVTKHLPKLRIQLEQMLAG
jgi:uncharacterized protein with HEPN domain